MKVIGIIPARYGSTRFPGKPLAMIGDKIMIQRVYEQAIQVIKDVWVATDDLRIARAVEHLRENVIMTGEHPNGTSRCAEITKKLGLNPDDIVVNIQGDQPFILPAYIEMLVKRMRQVNAGIATIASSSLSEEDNNNPNCVKVLISEGWTAMDFSRRRYNAYFGKWMKHVGVYAFRVAVLQELVKLPQTEKEKERSLEQLRWLWNDYKIEIVHVLGDVLSVDTPEDLIRANEYLQKQ
jgi:3-deoxy-manno-octulosonate cytidylyltransferase (CMP-KDO synthetase)